ncbi:hypothetical protein [Massilia phyllosphaerae]|uniref:hypothetical protein n=1 Tax=Massilia phyllosphaerae TaxID=3106034 RepID=UPI002B1CCAC0|nr:hypothetical protein [Massilia sp. SGZ-792]
MSILAKFLKTCAAVVLLSLGVAKMGIAGGVQTGKIKFLTLRGSDGLILVDLDGPLSGKPSCASYSYWIIKSETSLVGKQQLAFLLAAKTMNQTVSISGTGSCTRWHDGEDIDAIQLQ